MSKLEWLANVWTILFAVGTLVAAMFASGHAILYKRDTRATILWVSFIWFAPYVGPLIYLIFGVNRIRRRAGSLKESGPRIERAGGGDNSIGRDTVLPRLIGEKPNFKRLSGLVGSVTGLPIVSGNLIEPYFGGDEAYPAMIAAIDKARESVALCTYIFDRDPAGLRFVDALSRAVARGVQVRVLIDDSGARYSFPSIVRKLRAGKVPVARFLPSLAPLKVFALNMRNHRKIMVVDGEVGFTGGMNIRAGNQRTPDGRLKIKDIHFRLEGPAVHQMQAVFVDDWVFTTGEVLDGPVWFPDLDDAGDVYVRGINDGPDDAIDRLRWTILGALASAHERVCIATPYFLPDGSLISALNTAALRGVKVEILLPEKNNLPFVHWAMVAHYWQVLVRGCRIFYTPGAFDHSKVMIVDDRWTMVGSANWDPRSLRLNFEYNLECYSKAFAARMTEWFDARLAEGREITLQQVNGRSVFVRLRDGIARLATPLL